MASSSIPGGVSVGLIHMLPRAQRGQGAGLRSHSWEGPLMPDRLNLEAGPQGGGEG